MPFVSSCDDRSALVDLEDHRQRRPPRDAGDRVGARPVTPGPSRSSRDLRTRPRTSFTVPGTAAGRRRRAGLRDRRAPEQRADHDVPAAGRRRGAGALDRHPGALGRSRARLGARGSRRPSARRRARDPPRAGPRAPAAGRRDPGHLDRGRTAVSRCDRGGARRISCDAVAQPVGRTCRWGGSTRRRPAPSRHAQEIREHPGPVPAAPGERLAAGPNPSGPAVRTRVRSPRTASPRTASRPRTASPSGLRQPPSGHPPSASPPTVSLRPASPPTVTRLRSPVPPTAPRATVRPAFGAPAYGAPAFGAPPGEPLTAHRPTPSPGTGTRGSAAAHLRPLDPTGRRVPSRLARVAALSRGPDLMASTSVPGVRPVRQPHRPAHVLGCAHARCRRSGDPRRVGVEPLGARGSDGAVVGQEGGRSDVAARRDG